MPINNEQLDGLLARIPEPTPPPAFKATVMARIAREADQPLPDPAVVRTQRRRDRRAWMLASTGLLLAAGALAYPYLAAQVIPDLSARMSPISAGAGAASGSLGILVAVGLLLYLAGLFAPLSQGDSRRQRRTS